MPYKINPVTGNLDYYEAPNAGNGANLAYTASPTTGVVASDTGTDATIPLATTTNSGLFSPSEKSKLAIALVEEGINYRGDYNNGASYGYDQVVSTPVGSPYGLPGQLFIRVSNPNNPGYPPGTSSWELYDIYTGSPAFDYWVRSALGTKVTVEVGKGLSTEDYTTAEQTKLSGIAAGAEVNVNPDWDATSGDAQILNKPTIPSISGLSTVTYVDNQDALKVDKVVGSRLITTAEGTILGNTSGINSGDNATNTQYSGLAASKQNTITLTTTGTSGAATLVGSTLNVPQYSGGTTDIIPNYSSNETFRGITISNNTATVVAEGGVVISTTGTISAQTAASTNFAAKQIRIRVATVSVSGGRYQGTRGSALLWFIQGGFRFVCDFNIADTSFSAGCQQFYGLGGQTGDLGYAGTSAILIGTLFNIIGIGNEITDTNLQVIHNNGSGTATKIDLGAGFPANRTAGAISTTIYSIQLYNAPSSTDVKYRVINKETGEIAQGTLSTKLPLATQGLNFFASRCMATTSVTSTGQFELSKLGVYSL